MEKRNQNIFQKIIDVLIIAIFVITTIFIGLPKEDNLGIVNILISITAILSLIHNRKSKFFQLKITDMFLVIIIIASILPLILKTYVSLNNTVNYILRYISVSFMYFIIRKESENNSKLSDYIENTLIIIGMFLIVIGIELMTTQYLKPIVEQIIGKMNIFTYEIRMSSLFMYPNTFAIYMSIIALLLLGKIDKNKNLKWNTSYLVMLMWAFIGMFSSESRLTCGISAIVIVIYLIINKNNIYTNVRNLLVNGVLAIIITSIYFNLINLGMYIQIWIGVVLVTAISWVINYYQQKIKSIKIDFKIIVVICLAVFIMMIVLLNLKSELILFKGRNAQTTIRKTLCKIDNTKNYTFKIELDAKSDIEENFTISIIEQNKLYTDTKETNITVDNYQGTKEITITPLSDTVYSRIYFKCNEVNENTELKIKAIYVNNKEVIINYKFLPSELMAKLRTSGIISRNLTERIGFLQSAIIGTIDNKGIGIGGGGWQYAHAIYQDYRSEISEVHSYVGQLSIEFGILGITAYLGIVISLIIYSVKDIRKNGSLLCAILVIVLHSILDFDMSYFFIMLVVYSLIAILTSKTENNIKLKINQNIMIIITTLISIISIIINAIALYSDIYLETKMLEKDKTYTKTIEMQAENIRLNPYKKEYLETYITTWQVYKNNIENIKEEDKIKFAIITNNNIEKLFDNEPLYINLTISKMLENNTIMLAQKGETKNVVRYLELIYKIYQNIGITCKYNPMFQIEQIKDMKEFTEKLKEVYDNEWIEKFEKIIKEKQELVSDQIKQYEKCEITEEESQQYLRSLEE